MKFFWLPAITSVFAMVILAACEGGAPAAETSRVTGDTAPAVVAAIDTPLPVVEPAPAPKTTPIVKIGSAVGERVPDFEVTFRDGSSVSREELAAEGRPVFLFFMATW